MTNSRKGKTPARKPRARKARGNPDGLPVNGRRSHSTVNDSPELRKIVTDLYFAQPEWSIEQKLDWIHKEHPEFRTLSWSALQRWYDKFEKHVIEQDTMLSLARALKANIEEDGLMLTSVAGELAQAKVFESFMAGTALDEADQIKINMQSRLNSSAASRERARRSVEKDIRRGAMRVKDDLRKVLKGHPELAEKLAKIIDARTDEIVQEASRR
jgi:hypothetical protein